MNHLNIDSVIVAYDDALNVHLVRDGNAVLTFTDAGKLEVVGQGLSISESTHLKASLFEIDGELKGLTVKYPGCLIESLPFVLRSGILEFLIKVAKSPFATFHTQYLATTETGRAELRKIIAGFSAGDYRNYKPVDGVKILKALRLYIIIGDYADFYDLVGDIDDPQYHRLLEASVYNELVKRTIEVMYGKFDAPFNVDYSTFPIEVAQPYPTALIEQWVQDNQLDMKAGIWSDSTQLS